jgi:hypothetical protein
VSCFGLPLSRRDRGRGEGSFSDPGSAISFLVYNAFAMPTKSFLIIGIITLLLLSGLGLFIVYKTPFQRRRLTLVFYIQSLALILLFVIFSLAQGWESLLLEPGPAVLVLCSPVLLGLLTRVFAAIFRRLPVSSAWSRFAILGLCLVILVFLFALMVQPYALFIAILPGAIILTFVWLLLRDSFINEIILSLLFILLMGVSRTGMLEPLLHSLPDWLGLILRPIFFLQAGFVVGWSAWLAFNGAEALPSTDNPSASDQGRPRTYAAYLHLGLAMVILLSLLYTIFWVSIWDHTDNSLGGIWMAITGGFISLAAGGLIMERRKGSSRLVGFMYLLPVTALLFIAFGVGIRFPYHPISDRRAALIQEAIQQFYLQNGRYPAELDQLVPHQLLWVPRQVVLRNEAWCYQGGDDYYRLGDFWRQSFGSLIEIKTYALEGNPPDAGWSCLEDLVKMEFRYNPPPLIGGGQ